MRALLDHEIDIAIEGMHERNPSLNYKHLFNEKASIYRLKSLNKQIKLPIITRREHIITNRIFKTLNLEAGPEANSVEAVAILIASGKCCGILPIHYAKSLSQSIPLCRIENAPSIEVEFNAVTDPRRELPLCAEKFLEILLERCEMNKK